MQPPARDPLGRCRGLCPGFALVFAATARTVTHQHPTAGVIAWFWGSFWHVLRHFCGFLMVDSSGYLAGCWVRVVCFLTETTETTETALISLGFFVPVGHVATETFVSDNVRRRAVGGLSGVWCLNSASFCSARRVPPHAAHTRPGTRSRGSCGHMLGRCWAVARRS